MEYIELKEQIELSNDGVVSKQLLSPHNSTNEDVTITRVTVSPNAEQPRHKHDTSDQIWTALKGSATLLLGSGATKMFNEGDVVRFEKGDIHGLLNDSEGDFEYLSVTTPPINFNYAYKKVGK